MWSKRPAHQVRFLSLGLLILLATSSITRGDILRWVQISEMHIPEPSAAGLLVFGTCVAMTLIRNRRCC